jgi:hypothetical protein
MALVVCEQGPLWSAVTDALLSAGKHLATARPGTPELFLLALDKQTIVYAPAPSLLGGTLEPRPSRRRMHRVLRAANAPGVRLLVLLVPAAGGFAEEEALLRRSGKPYVVLRSPPLLDEIAEQMGTAEHEALWVPRAGVAEATDAERLGAALLEALDGEHEGSSIRVKGDTLDAAELFGRAANLFATRNAEPRLHIHGVWPPLYRVTRRMLKLLGRPEPAALELWDRLGRQGLGSPRPSMA